MRPGGSCFFLAGRRLPLVAERGDFPVLSRGAVGDTLELGFNTPTGANRLRCLPGRQPCLVGPAGFRRYATLSRPIAAGRVSIVEQVVA
jgi:hypothetical protein